MKQVNIIKNNVVTNSATFQTQAELDQWLAYHESIKSFGEKDIYVTEQILVTPEVRGPVQILVTPAEFDEYGEEITPPIFRVDPNGLIEPAVYESQTRLVSPAEYTVEITDISSQIEQARINKEAKAFLAATDWMVVRAMERGESLSPEFKAEREAARASIVE